MFKIREMNRSDIIAINVLAEEKKNVHLHQEEQPISDTTFENILAGNTERLYVIEKSGVIRAFILFQLNDELKQIRIKMLTIEASYNKKGLDEHLYSKVERLAEKKRYEQMLAEITTENETIQTFFDENGWQRMNNSDEFYKGVNG